MKFKTLALAACLVMPFQSATADVVADFSAGMSLDKVMLKAVETMSIEEAVAKMTVAHPEIVGLIVKVAVEAYPSLVREIVVAAIMTAPKFKDAIGSAAIAAGASQADVAAATAAAATGKKSPSVTVVVTTPVSFPDNGASAN